VPENGSGDLIGLKVGGPSCRPIDTLWGTLGATASVYVANFHYSSSNAALSPSFSSSLSPYSQTPLSFLLLYLLASFLGIPHFINILRGTLILYSSNTTSPVSIQSFLPSIIP
jgi:hypothetical protein